MKIPLTDLNIQYEFLKDEIDEAIRRVLESGQFILSREVEAFEEAMATYCGTEFAVGVASGTDALQLALLGCGINPGDEVITTPFTFIATTEAIRKCRAIPVFTDIVTETCNLNPAEIEPKITPRTKAILPVHLYGQAADMTPILKLTEAYDLKVIEDCAQALGAEYQGRQVGSIGAAGCLSFFPSKMLGAYGDGGMVITNDAAIAEKVAMLRNHGGKNKNYNLIPGFNSRLDSLQAAVLRVKLRYLDKWIRQRQQRAEIYSRLLNAVVGLKPPHTAASRRHVFNYYTIRLEKGSNQGLRDYLAARDIASAVYYPLSLHLQALNRDLGYRPGVLPHSETAQEEVLSLPMYPELREEQILQIVAAVSEFCKQTCAST